MKRYIKPYHELTFSDDFMFGRVMADPSICKHVLELILNIKIKEIQYLEKQKHFQPKEDSKGIYLDVYVDDLENTVYNIEMQTAHFAELPKRSRYYQSIIDSDSLSPGQHYNDLKNSFIIFICTKDIFHLNRPVYTFENLCLQDLSLRLNDGAQKIFLNASGSAVSGEITSGLKMFLDYVATGKISDDFTNTLENAVSSVKSNKNLEVSYMTFATRLMDEREEGRKEGREEGRKEGREEGRKEGREEGRKEGREEGREEGRDLAMEEICIKALENNISVEIIMSITGLTQSEIEKIDKER